MDAAAPIILLVAKLLILEPSGTRTLSEHTARIPAGASGLLREEIHEAGFPGVVHLLLKPGLVASASAEAGDSFHLSMRSDLWASLEDEREGRAPDESNTDDALIAAGTSGLVQIAESRAGDRRLVVSLKPSILDPAADVRPILPSPPATPEPIALRVDLYRDSGGARELLTTSVLKTVDGYAVSFHSELRRAAPASPRRAGASAAPSAEAQREGKIDEGLTLTLRPTLASPGWVTVEARVEGAYPASGGADPIPFETTAVRLVPLGIPFEVSVPPSGAPGSSAPGSAGGGHLLQITAFKPTEPAPPPGRPTLTPPSTIVHP